MDRLRFYPILLCSGALLVAGCSSARERVETPEVPAAVVAAVGDVFIRSAFQPGPGDTGQPAGGAVRVIDLPNTSDMQIQVELSGLTTGAHAWHIHSGACGQQAPVLVAFTPTAQMQGLDEPITANANGEAKEDARIPSDRLTRQQLEAGAYSVHVHQRAGLDHGPTVACANL